MNFLRSAVTEIVGLFVDDWVFALLLCPGSGFSAFGPACRPRSPRRCYFSDWPS